MADNTNVRAGQRHCGAVRFEVTLMDGFNSIVRCTCSYCRMRGAVVVMAEMGGMKFLQGENAPTSDRFHTGAAQHFFCSRCGIGPSFLSETHVHRKARRQLYERLTRLGRINALPRPSPGSMTATSSRCIGPRRPGNRKAVSKRPG